MNDPSDTLIDTSGSLIDNVKKIMDDIKKIMDDYEIIYILGGLSFIVFYYLIFYYWNPLSVNDKYPTIIYFGYVILIFLSFYVFISKKDTLYQAVFDALKTIGIYIGIFIALFGILYLVTKYDIFSNIYYLIIKIIIISGFIGIGYYFFNNEHVDKVLKVGIIKEIILYLPCLFISFSKWIKKEFELTSSPVFIMLIIEFVIIFLYLVTPLVTNYIMNYNNTLLLKEPEYLNKPKLLGKYGDLYEEAEKDIFDDKHKYKFSLSFWYWINPQPPNVNSNYTKYTDILSYGGKPALKYNGMENKLRVTCLVIEEVEEVEDIEPETKKLIFQTPDDFKTRLFGMSKDEETVKLTKEVVKETKKTIFKPIEKVIFETNDIKHQKWNQMVITFDSGTIDVFMNGVLVGTRDDVIPYKTYDSIISGVDKGIHGGICNVSYHKDILSKNEILSSYIVLKNNDIPIL